STKLRFIACFSSLLAKKALRAIRRNNVADEAFTNSKSGVSWSLFRRTPSGKPTAKFETSEKFFLSPKKVAKIRSVTLHPCP
ncbi:MAG: hypothetical protein IJ408_00580, partial [Clostridia bacterium]|nr:hypothetical protein [Clostridia bacterium]